MKLPFNIASFFSTFWVKFALIIAIIIGLFSAGYKIGYDLRDRSALQEQQKITQQAVIDANKYKQQIQELLTKQHGLSTQLDQALEQNQKVVTKYVDKTIVKEIHDHPNDYQCTIPAAGMRILSNQAAELNHLRSGPDQNH